MPHYVNVHSIPRGWWFWEYDSPHQRRKGKRITIGIEFLAEKPYQGNLEVAVTANECDHNLHLRFEINKRITK